MEPNGYYWYIEHDDDGALVYDCVCDITGYFATLLLPGGSTVNNLLVSRMDGQLTPLARPQRAKRAASGEPEMVSHYSVVTGASLTIHGALIELAREVRGCMEHGWEPLGGAFYCGQEFYSQDSDHVFAQTVVKREVSGEPS